MDCSGHPSPAPEMARAGEADSWPQADTRLQRPVTWFVVREVASGNWGIAARKPFFSKRENDVVVASELVRHIDSSEVQISS